MTPESKTPSAWPSEEDFCHIAWECFGQDIASHNFKGLYAVLTTRLKDHVILPRDQVEKLREEIVSDVKSLRTFDCLNILDAALTNNK